MSTPRAIMPAPAKLSLRVLSESDVRSVHEAALELLAGDADAAVEALAHAPSVVALVGRVPEHDVALGDGSSRLAAGSLGAPATTVQPLGGGDPRPAVAADLDDACRLADALPEVALVAGPPVCGEGTGTLAALARCLAATTKHVVAVAVRTAAEARAAIRLAEAVTGSPDSRPLSLCAGLEGRDAVTVAAAAGLCTGLVLAPGGPDRVGRDLATALVRHHAGVLSGCAAVQREAPGAPFLYVAAPAFASLPAAGPVAAVFQIAATQLAAHVGLPVIAAGMATGSHDSDWQACTQNAFASLSTTAARAHVTAGAGTLAGGATFSLRQLVMDAEIYSWNAAIAAGVPVDQETIALGAIEDVGIGGNFLSQRHTRRHMRDVWRPRLLDRSMWDAWVASGREGAAEKATAFARQLLAEHEVVPLPDQVRATVERIVAEAGL